MEHVAKKFNKIAEEYDATQKKLIPISHDFYQIAINSIQIKDPQPNVLEIGAGTGMFTEIFLKKYNNAKMDLVDISKDMLNIAKERFEGNPNINFYIKNIEEFKPKENKQYDAIITSLAIHHLPDSEKEELYNKIGKWIKSGGIFVNTELIAGETEYLNEIYEDWQIQRAIDLGIDENLKEKVLGGMEHDIKAPVSKQLTWLKNAGFSHIDCIYKAYCLGVLWAKK